MNSKNEKQLRKVLRQFSINVLFDDVLTHFSPWVACDTLTSEIQRLKCKTNQASIADVLINLLKETNINDKNVEELLPLFMLLGVASNSSRKTWTTYTLEGSVLFDKSEKDLEADIRHFLLANDAYATAVVKCVDACHWVQVVEKKIVKKRLRVYAPFYVAHFIGEPYIFLSKREASHAILKSLAEGFGYTRYKFSNLNGHDLESMLKHLIQKGAKRGYVASTQSLNNFTVTQSGKDFSQHENRRKFISNLMGSSPPKLSNYVVLAKNLPWKGKLCQDQMRGRTFDMKIEFKTEDTVEMLKDMAECDILKVPPPSYVANLLSTGKNNIKLRVQGANGVTDTENNTDA